jgi:flagellar motor protein MotB
MQRSTPLRIASLSVLALAALVTGCAPQSEVDREETRSTTFENRVFELQQQLDQCESTSAALRERNQQQEEIRANLERQISSQQRQLASLQGQLETIDQRLRSVGQGMLAPELEAALADLAARDPELFTYDEGAGMIMLGSDVTFNPGSTDLKKEASDGLKALAEALKPHLDLPFEIWIVGHTDSVPIGKSRDRHPTNTHLAVHRAISVKSVLVGAGLPADRVGVGGWGEYRPLVPPRQGGEPENRRVEIEIRPMADRSGLSMPPSGASSASEAPPEDLETPMK